MQKELDKDKIEREIQELVIERLKLIPSDKNISIGGATFTRSQIIDHVQKKDEIGKQVVEVELSYLKALKRGDFFEFEE